MMILMGQPDRPTAPKRGDYQMSIIITKNADGTTHEEWNKEEYMLGAKLVKEMCQKLFFIHFKNNFQKCQTDFCLT